MRILTEERGDAYTLSLQGRIAGEWVPVLERCWRSILREAPSAKITAILSDVSYIDADGERLLERMWRGGAAFVASGCLNRFVVERIQRRRST